ncbi:MAG TPA: hypothetical protein VHD34_01290 [Xanthobacteraceae bacterium]|nr:hypothetical protein [Xanthobacteraceae bacterium]
MPRSFLPSARATNVLVAIGLIALCYAMYVRYMLIETSTVARVCAKLQATSVACKAAEFDGQRLSVR